MSSLYRHLGGLFRKTSKAPATAAADTIINTSQLTGSESTPLSAAATKEKQLKSLVDKFKKSSESSRFRRRHLNYEPAVRRLAAAGRFSSIHDILNHQKQYRDITDERFTVRLLWLYGKSQMSDHALDLFEEMPQLNCPRTVLSFNALMAACVHSKQFDKTVKLFHEIPEKLSIQPDIVSYNTVIKAFCELGSFDTAVSMMDELDKMDIQPTTATFNTLLYAFYKSGRFDKAETIWGLMDKKKASPDARSYNAKLHGLVKEKRVMEAVGVVEGMEARGVKPDSFSYNVLIKGFVDEENLNEVKRWYKEMIDNGCTPDLATFRMLIPFACDTGDIDFAHELAKKSIDVNRIFFLGIQQVINKLMEQSKVNEAKELMELGSSIRVLRHKLSMPTEGLGATDCQHNCKQEEPSLQA
ncbi:Pentatricopeptide repeat-containing protein [Abeliophyllum distichum]|uniref:Pentatricopeptide repeat-containing protein n=1 Tax=Abeliophyllum distichum TaxID=126358 RepID=A0ABD1QHW9_9LAMI